jgi:NitT/TauT family transport system substrate-binding protein
VGAGSAAALAQDSVRFAVPTAGYWSTVVANAAHEKGLFEENGVEDEIIVFRSGADAYQALAAGAADIALTTPNVVAKGQMTGVDAKIVGVGSDGPLGWHLVVKADSPIKEVSELAGKKVGMNSAGSLSDLLGRWAAGEAGVEFELVPLGGGGVAPNLMAGNIDATVLYAPVTYELLEAGEVRSLVDFSQAMPKAAVDTWVASGQALAEKGEAINKAITAIFEAVALLQGDKDYAVDLIMRSGDVSEETAVLEYERTIMSLPAQNNLDPALVDQYLSFDAAADPATPKGEELIAATAR